MSTILFVNGSPRQKDSRSGVVASAFLDAVRQRSPSIDVDTIDLWREPLPEFDGPSAAAKMAVITGESPAGASATSWQGITQIIERFLRADQYLFTVPMWNGGIPGAMFGFDPVNGYTGLVRGKRATVVYTSGVYAPGAPAAFGLDFHSSYFDWWLRFIGIEDVRGIRCQPTLLTPNPDAVRDQAVAEARAAAVEAADETFV